MNESKLELTQSPVEFFREKIGSALRKQRIEIPTEVEYYLVTLMCDFIVPEKLTISSGCFDPLSTPVAFLYKEALEAIDLTRYPQSLSDQIKTIEAIVRIIASAFANVVLQQKVTHLENKLEERKLVDRAKGVLMKMKHMDENQAYRFLQKEAMEKRRSIGQIAEAVLLVWK